MSFTFETIHKMHSANQPIAENAVRITGKSIVLGDAVSKGLGLSQTARFVKLGLDVENNAIQLTPTDLVTDGFTFSSKTFPNATTSFWGSGLPRGLRDRIKPGDYKPVDGEMFVFQLEVA